MVHRCLLLVHRYLITIQSSYFLSAIHVTVQLMDHLAIRHIFTIQILDVSGNRKPTVFQKKNYLVVLSLLLPYCSMPHQKGPESVTLGSHFLRRVRTSLAFGMKTLRVHQKGRADLKTDRTYLGRYR